MGSTDVVRRRDVGDLLALGFGTSVAMWAVAYVGRLPAVMATAAVLAPLMVVCLVAGGFLAGAWTRRGWGGGVATGVLASAVNLLVLGSLLTGDQPNRIVPSALWWIPGSLVAGGLLGAAGVGLSRVAPRRESAEKDWTGVLAKVAASATFLLVIVGGLVTSHDAGLAVVDWPNSFGYNMFLYPLSRMTGGIYYEHAHRLFGSLVGLVTVVLAVRVFRTDNRRGVRGLALLAVAAVIAQGILGGLRVTGRLTMSSSPDAVAPSTPLALVHGVIGQLFFALMVAIAVVASARWKAVRDPANRRGGPGGAEALAFALVGLLVFQIAVGGVLRHLAAWLMLHIVVATLVFFAALACGTVTTSRFPRHAVLRPAGVSLLVGVVVQMLLGVGALVVTRGSSATQAVGALDSVEAVGAVDATITTAHQAVGALLLACSVVIALWAGRAGHEVSA